jgi:hypothetical protein
MTKNEILCFLKEHKIELQEKYGVTSIGLFGSYAKDCATNKSDVDLAIQMKDESKTLSNYMKLKRFLERNLKSKVDLGIEDTLKTAVRNSILTEIIYV